MKLLRALLCGALLWALIFFEVSVLKFGFNLEGIFYNVVHYVLLIILTFVAAMFYFKNTERSFEEGILAGAVFVILGIVLDAIITVPILYKDYIFFANPLLWAGFGLVIVVSGIVGTLKR